MEINMAVASGVQIMTKPGALDKLAKLLASENIMIEHKPIKTAYFDVKNRVLALPIWKEMTVSLYHLLVLHEVGHALETPADGWKGAIDKIEEEHESKRTAQTFQGYLNVVEDARIERKVKIKFPGSRRDFIEGYKWLYDNDFFETKNEEVNDLSFIDRINLYFKIGTIVRIKFSEEERVFVQRAENTITFNDVIELARDIFDYVKAKKEEEIEQAAQNVDLIEDEDGDEYEFDDGDEEGDDEGDEDSESRSKAKRDKEETGGNGSVSEQAKSSTADKIDEAKTDRAMSDRMEELLDPSLSNRQFKYIYYPKDIAHEPFTYSYKEILELVEEDLARAKDPRLYRDYCAWMTNNFRRENNNAINYMVKEFEMKKAAIAYSRSKQAKTGVIDVNKLHSYKFNDDIFKRLNIVPDGKNHGVVAILDMSGSMSQNFRGAMDQLISLAMFCRRVGIPHRFYGFTSVISGSSEIYTKTKKARVAQRQEMKRRIELRLNKDFVFPDDEFDLIELFTEKMNLKDFNFMVGVLLAQATRYDYHNAGPNEFTESRRIQYPIMSVHSTAFNHNAFRYFGLGGTPLNDALLVSRDLLNKFRKEKNVQIMNFICITDGESNQSLYCDFDMKRRMLFKYNRSYYDTRTDIFIDEETRMQTTISFDSFSGITAMFARIVRESTNSTFVGFYITTSTYEVKSAISRYLTSEAQEKSFAKYKKDKNLIVPKMLNFDEFYLIQGGVNLQVQQAKFEEAKSLTKGQLAKAFIGAQNKRGASRMVLSRFIDKIAA
jgi:hypothetical protein